MSDNPILTAFVFLAAGLAFVALLRTLGTLLVRYWHGFEKSVSIEMGRSFLFVNAGRLFVANLLAVLVLVLFSAWLFESPYPAIAIALAAAFLPRFMLRRMRARRMAAFREQIPELISMLAGSLEAGTGLSAALADLALQLPAPSKQELAMVLREQRMGATLDRSLQGLARRMPVEEVVLLVCALRLGGKVGAGMAQSLHALADATRRRLVLERKIGTLTAQGKLQAWVMGLLPFGVLVALLSLDPSLMDLYFGSIAGWSVISVTLVLQALGVFTIRRLVDIEV